MQLVAGSAGAVERALSIDANVLASPIMSHTLIHIWRDQQHLDYSCAMAKHEIHSAQGLI